MCDIFNTSEGAFFVTSLLNMPPKYAALNRRMQRLRHRGEPMTPPACPGHCSVKKPLTAKRRYRITENDEYAAFLRRLIRPAPPATAP